MTHFISFGNDELAKIPITVKAGDMIEIIIHGDTYIAPLEYGETFHPDGSSRPNPNLGFVSTPAGYRMVSVSGRITHPHARKVGGAE